jgi:hypothetical protein
MTPHTLVDLPSEAVKAILSFMTRKQLIVLSGVNIKFYSVIHSPPLRTRPLLRVRYMNIYRYFHLGGEEQWGVTLGTSIAYHIAIKDLDVHFGRPILSQQWVRFESEFRIKLPFELWQSCSDRVPGIVIWLPGQHELQQALLELFYYENSHCLLGAKALRIYYLAELEEADVVAIIDKFRTLVLVEARRIRDGLELP